MEQGTGSTETWMPIDSAKEKHGHDDDGGSTNTRIYNPCENLSPPWTAVNRATQTPLKGDLDIPPKCQSTQTDLDSSPKCAPTQADLESSPKCALTQTDLESSPDCHPNQSDLQPSPEHQRTRTDLEISPDHQSTDTDPQPSPDLHAAPDYRPTQTICSPIQICILLSLTTFHKSNRTIG